MSNLFKHPLSEAVRARQQTWLKADLQVIKPYTPVIIVTHYPLKPEWFDERRAEGVNILCQLAGHWHCVQVGSYRDVPVLITAPARGLDWGAYSNAYRWVHIRDDGIRTDLRIAGQYQRLEVIAPGATATLGAQPLLLLAYDSARKVESVKCIITAPDGSVQSPELTQRGDWSWQGQFSPHLPGKWEFALEATFFSITNKVLRKCRRSLPEGAGIFGSMKPKIQSDFCKRYTDVSGKRWKRGGSIEITDKRLAEPQTGTDMPWILAGNPPRVFLNGPNPPLYPLWVKHTGSVHVLHASPVVAGDGVYAAITNPNAGVPDSGVLCLDAKTGQQRWRVKSPRGDVRGAVTLRKGRVYAVTGEGWVASFDAHTGEAVWARPLKPEYTDGRPLAINQTPPIPTRFGLLVSDWQTPQFLLDYETGEEIARFEANVGYYAAFATVFDDIMYIARRYGRVALKLPSGEVVWEGEEPARSTSAGIVVDGRFIYNAASSVKVLDASTGSEIWHTPVPNAGFQNPIPVVWRDLILVNGVHFTAVDFGAGAIRWTIPCAQDPTRFVRSQRITIAGNSTPIVAGDFAYFGHDDTSIRAVDYAGQLVWEYRLGTPIKTAPVVSGNLLFVRDYAGNLWCFAPSV